MSEISQRQRGAGLSRRSLVKGAALSTLAVPVVGGQVVGGAVVGVALPAGAADPEFYLELGASSWQLSSDGRWIFVLKGASLTVMGSQDPGTVKLEWFWVGSLSAVSFTNRLVSLAEAPPGWEFPAPGTTAVISNYVYQKPIPGKTLLALPDGPWVGPSVTTPTTGTAYLTVHVGGSSQQLTFEVGTVPAVAFDPKGAVFQPYNGKPSVYWDRAPNSALICLRGPKGFSVPANKLFVDVTLNGDSTIEDVEGGAWQGWSVSRLAKNRFRYRYKSAVANGADLVLVNTPYPQTGRWYFYDQHPVAPAPSFSLTTGVLDSNVVQDTYTFRG